MIKQQCFDERQTGRDTLSLRRCVRLNIIPWENTIPAVIPERQQLPHRSKKHIKNECSAA